MDEAEVGVRNAVRPGTSPFSKWAAELADSPVCDTCGVASRPRFPVPLFPTCRESSTRKSLLQKNR